ncbi:MAG TPA: PH domain-containing protein [Nitrososphaeraceae archaeon]|nr:PH domain-containing protein [Nitrososphaeraceae archaeon]
MSAIERRSGEKMILQEDCAEDKLRNGILTLTNRRLIFEKTEGRMVLLSKKTGEAVLDIPLDKISSVKAEGVLIKKVTIIVDHTVYKFGVFNNSNWVKAIEKQKMTT